VIRIKEGYSLRKVLDVYLVLGTGSEAYMPNCIMSTNETGAFLWDKLKEGSEREQLISAMTAEYEVDEAAAAADIDVFLDQLRTKDLTVEC